MGNFTSNLLSWHTLHPKNKKSTNLPAPSILIESPQNLTISHWIIQKWMKFHEKEGFDRAAVSLEALERHFLYWSLAGDVPVEETKKKRENPDQDLSPDTEDEESTLSTDAPASLPPHLKGFMSRLQIHEMREFLATNRELLRNKISTGKVSEQDISASQHEPLHALHIKQTITESAGSQSSLVYDLAQVESSLKHISGHQLASRCRVFTVHAAWLHFSALLSTQDISRIATDSLQFIQSFRNILTECSRTKYSMFECDLWQQLQNGKKWSEMDFAQKNEYVCHMRLVLYLQNLDNYLLTEWTNTKLVQNDMRSLFQKMQRATKKQLEALIEAATAEGNGGDLSARSLPENISSALVDPLSNSSKKRRVRNMGRTLEQIQSPSVLESSHFQPPVRKKHEVIVDESRPILSARLMNQYRRAETSRSVPAESMRRASLPRRLHTADQTQPRDLSTTLNHVQSSSDEDDIVLSPRKRDFAILSEIEQKFSQVVRLLRSEPGKMKDSALLVALQYIQNLPLSQKTYQYALSDSHAIPSLLKLLTFDDLRIRLSVADIMVRLTDNPHLQFEIATRDGMQVLLSVVHKSTHVALTSLVTNILFKCCHRITLRQQFLHVPNALGIIFTKISHCLSVEDATHRPLLKHLVGVLHQVSFSSQSHQLIHEHNAVRVFGALLDQFFNFSDDLSSEKDSTGMLIPILGFLANICKDSRNLKLIDQLRLGQKILRTIVMYQETTDSTLIRIMAILIGRLSTTEDNLKILAHADVTHVLSIWFNSLVEVESDDPLVLYSHAVSILFALYRMLRHDTLLKAFVQRELTQNQEMLSQIIGFVNLREEMIMVRCSIHAMGILANLARLIGEQLLQRGVVSLICSTTLPSSIPNYILYSLEILRNLADTSSIEEVHREILAHNAFIRLGRLLQNKQVSIRVAAAQTLSALITTEDHAQRVARRTTSEDDAQDLAQQLTQILQETSSILQTAAAQGGTGTATHYGWSLQETALVCESTLEMMVKLAKSEWNLDVLSAEPTVQELLKCVVPFAEHSQLLIVTHVCSLLVQICPEAPDTILLINQTSFIQMILQILKSSAPAVLAASRESRASNNTEECGICVIAILRLLSELSKHAECVSQIASQDPFDVLLELMDSNYEMIQDLTGDTLSRVRHHLSQAPYAQESPE